MPAAAWNPSERDGDSPITLAEYLTDWLEQQRTRLQPSTWRSYRGNVDRYLLPHLGETRLGEVTVPQLDRLYNELLLRGGYNGKPLSLRTVRYVHAVLRSALEDARRIGLVDRNVARDATVPRIDPRTGATLGERQVNVWSADELRTFLDFVCHHPLRWLWIVAAGTGARRGELLALRWNDLDPAGPTLRIDRSLSVHRGEARLKQTKTGRPRTIHLDPRTADAFERRRQEQEQDRARTGDRWCEEWGGLVFTTETGRFVSPNFVTHEFRALVRAAPVPVIRLHDLRHTHATLLLSRGDVPIKVVSERLGHSSIQLTLDTYTHVLPPMDEAAASNYADCVWGDEDS